MEYLFAASRCPVADIVAAIPRPKRAKMERSFVTNGVEEKRELGQ
jgi:hypothetical protein